MPISLNDCWLWAGYVDSYGYGYLLPYIDKKLVNLKAHRVMYENLVAQIPEGLQIDHLCRVRHCVNPAHLEPVTPRENVMRGISHVALNPSKTHCPKDHPLSGDNLYITPKGKRNCKSCRSSSHKAWKQRSLVNV